MGKIAKIKLHNLYRIYNMSRKVKITQGQHSNVHISESLLEAYHQQCIHVYILDPTSAIAKKRLSYLLSGEYRQACLRKHLSVGTSQKYPKWNQNHLGMNLSLFLLQGYYKQPHG